MKWVGLRLPSRRFSQLTVEDLMESMRKVAEVQQARMNRSQSAFYVCGYKLAKQFYDLGFRQ